MHTKRIILLVLLVVALVVVSVIAFLTMPKSPEGGRQGSGLTEEQLAKFGSSATSSSLTAEDYKKIDTKYNSTVSTTTIPLTGEQLQGFSSQ